MENTPWFFDGRRVPIFPTDRLKIEPSLINGRPSCGTFLLIKLLRRSMADIGMVSLTLVFFAIALAYIAACARLE